MSSSVNNKKGQQEAKAAMTELITELDRTRKEYAKVTLQLTQLETSVQHLKDAELKKDQVIGHLESELERREEQHRHEVAVLEEEHRTKDAAWAHRVKQLEIELERLQQENQAMSMFEKENRQLRDTVLENQAVIERLQLINDDLRSRAKDDSREHAQQLEDEFRRRLAESEKRFRAEAYRALSEEAKLALQGNDHLQTVLQRQNDSIEAVLLRCKQLEQSHAKIQQEQDLSTQNLQHHMAEIQRLKKQLADSRAKNTQLEDALKQRKVERASLELLFIEYEASRKQLAKATEKCRRALREAERWRNRAVQLTHELGEDQREAGEAKLQTIQARSDAIERRIAGRRQRTEQRDNQRRVMQDGAAALRSAIDGDALGNSDDDWSQVSEDDIVADTEKHRAVNPMEILAMWNVNFESWRPGSLDDTIGGGGQTDEAAASGTPLDRTTASQQQQGSTGTAATGGADALVDDPAMEPLRSAPGLREALALASAPGSHPVPPPLSGASPRMLPTHTLGVADGADVGAGALPSVLGPVRPRGQRVDERRMQQDRLLSSLSQPKNHTLPPPARHFAQPAVPRGTHPIKSSINDLSVVSKGEFKMSKKSVDPTQQRFLVP